MPYFLNATCVIYITVCVLPFAIDLPPKPTIWAAFTNITILPAFGAVLDVYTFAGELGDIKPPAIILTRRGHVFAFPHKLPGTLVNFAIRNEFS